ncbi:MAG: sigma-54 interaction domain-containing protein [Thermodesulfovibrionales bacterium]
MPDVVKMSEIDVLLSKIEIELERRMDFVQIFSFLFGKIQEFFPFNYGTLLILNKNSEDFVFIKSIGLERESHKLAEDTIRPLFLQYLKTLSQYRVLVKSSEEWLNFPCKDIFHRFSLLTIFPIADSHGLRGSFILASTYPNNFHREDFYPIHTFLTGLSKVIKKAVFYDEEMAVVTEMVQNRIAFGRLVGKGPKMQAVYNLVEKIARTDSTVLILGETGTGKELLARTIHQKSHRREGPFIVAHCAGYAPTLIESELFGHEKGAFTGAIRQKKGRFELAQDGTLFLDEVGDIPLQTQVLLLRVLQDKEFERVGGEATIKTNARIIAATNKDLRQEINSGRFREDFYYRLNTITITLPPLRERKEDIPLLCANFLEECKLRIGKIVKDIAPEAMQRLIDYEWPGNVRELKSVIERAYILARGPSITPEDISFSDQIYHRPEKDISTLAENEKYTILNTLNKFNWNIKEAAQQLGISRATLYNKIKLYGIRKV